ncbi:hypothetical protein [Shewanella youngdeokensis]|uniref:Lipoprotein n=1 Tax=Shewanella youngdeokensis TaxID=2999068 RepID=A0ABZ0JVU4_9GAMM|nr:hypothetical protein RGE70_09610 [Shewanella sp. DAU334]
MLTKLIKKRVIVQNTYKSVLYSSIIILFVTINLSGCEPKSNKKVTSMVADPSICDFKNAACSKIKNGNKISLTISPWHAPSEKPLSLTLSSTEPLDDVSVRIEGRDMFMGVIPVNLTKTAKNTYNASLIYGSCSSNYMVWQAIVSYKQNGVNTFTTFEFLADKDQQQ